MRKSKPEYLKARKVWTSVPPEVESFYRETARLSRDVLVKFFTDTMLAEHQMQDINILSYRRDGKARLRAARWIASLAFFQPYAIDINGSLYCRLAWPTPVSLEDPTLLMVDKENAVEVRYVAHPKYRDSLASVVYDEEITPSMTVNLLELPENWQASPELFGESKAQFLNQLMQRTAPDGTISMELY